MPVRGGGLARANGIDLCYDTFGDGGDPPLLLIMGLACQMVVWDDEFCSLLAERGFFVIRFDNRDTGRSTKLVDARRPGLLEMLATHVTGLRFRVPYLLADMAADTVGLMDALGIASAHIVGISMGGAIAQEIAIRFPDRVRTMTSLLSSTGDPKLPGPRRKALARLGKRMPNDRAGFVFEYVETWRVLAGTAFPFDADLMRRHGEESFAHGINPAGAARQLLAIIASGDRTAALRGVTTPTLVVHGTEDPLIDVEGGRATARAVPGATLLLIEGMGHTLPREVWPRVIGAIAGHASRAHTAPTPA